MRESWKDRCEEAEVLKHLTGKPQTPAELIRRAGLADDMKGAGAFLTTLRDLAESGRVACVRVDMGGGCSVPAFYLFNAGCSVRTEDGKLPDLPFGKGGAA